MGLKRSSRASSLLITLVYHIWCYNAEDNFCYLIISLYQIAIWSANDQLMYDFFLDIG